MCHEINSSLGDEIMFSNIGFPGLILILIVALVIFGPNKLPEIGRAFGKSLREFKKATEGIADDIKQEIKEDISEAKQEKIDLKK
jgi:sec-independent protein translocase protein TatA